MPSPKNCCTYPKNRWHTIVTRQNLSIFFFFEIWTLGILIVCRCLNCYYRWLFVRGWLMLRSQMVHVTGRKLSINAVHHPCRHTNVSLTIWCAYQRAKRERDREYSLSLVTGFPWTPSPQPHPVTHNFSVYFIHRTQEYFTLWWRELWCEEPVGAETSDRIQYREATEAV